MDFHQEQIVKAKKDSSKSGFTVIIFFVTAVLWFIILNLLHMLPTVCAALIVLVGWGALKLLQGLSVEYEYEVLNQYLDIAKIFGKSRRKQLFSIDFTSVEQCGYVTEEGFKNTYGIKKTCDCSGNPTASGRVFVDFVPEGKSEKLRVIFLPDDKIKDILKKSAPQKVKL